MKLTKENIKLAQYRVWRHVNNDLSFNIVYSRGWHYIWDRFYSQVHNRIYQLAVQIRENIKNEINH